MMSLSQAAQCCGGQLLGVDGSFFGAAIDSRAISPRELFIALRGVHQDGHDFVDDASRRGAAGALVDHRLETTLPQIIVADVQAALGKIAAAWRAAWQGMVAAITGSNGKTTVKDMLAAILDKAAPTLATAGNFNNELGLPLTLLRLRDTHRYAVLEMGASAAGEIATLARMARPQVGLITNASAAHLQGFGDVAGVARGKAELFAALTADGIGVVNADDPFAPLWREMLGDRRRVEYSLCADAEAEVRRVGHGGGVRGGKLEFRVGDEHVAVTPRFIGEHNHANALAALAAGHALGLAADQMAHGLAVFRPPPGRLELIEVAGGLLVNDSYNANPASARAAIEAVAQLGAEEIWLALGDMRELGDSAPRLHREIGDFAREHGVSRVLSVGEMASLAGERWRDMHHHFDDAAQLGDYLAAHWHRGLTCLVKGSRAMHMEDALGAVCRRFDVPSGKGGPH